MIVSWVSKTNYLFLSVLNRSKIVVKPFERNNRSESGKICKIRNILFFNDIII